MINNTNPGSIAANASCFSSMALWALSFPIAEVLLESWGTIALAFYRQLIAVAVLLLIWILIEGWLAVRSAQWLRGFLVGGTGFGAGALLLLYGQKLSDPVTPTIAAAMMPIAGATLEVVLDGTRIRKQLVIGLVLAITGGLLATGVNLVDGSFGLGAVYCLIAVILFAWATRSITRDFPTLSPLGRTTVTLMGGTTFIFLVYTAGVVTQMDGTRVGTMDAATTSLLVGSSIVSLAFSQLLWIWGAGGLGILLASFHMNALPFYVMVTVVVFLGKDWSWIQTAGAVLVAIGVMISQSPGQRSRRTMLR